MALFSSLHATLCDARGVGFLSVVVTVVRPTG